MAAFTEHENANIKNDNDKNNITHNQQSWGGSLAMSYPSEFTAFAFLASAFLLGVLFLRVTSEAKQRKVHHTKQRHRSRPLIPVHKKTDEWIDDEYASAMEEASSIESLGQVKELASPAIHSLQQDPHLPLLQHRVPQLVAKGNVNQQSSPMRKATPSPSSRTPLAIQSPLTLKVTPAQASTLHVCIGEKSACFPRLPLDEPGEQRPASTGNSQNEVVKQEESRPIRSLRLAHDSKDDEESVLSDIRLDDSDPEWFQPIHSLNLDHDKEKYDIAEVKSEDSEVQIGGIKPLEFQPIDSSTLEDVDGDEEVSEHSQVQLDEVEKLSLLGEGKFGQVWLVLAHNRPCALKLQSKVELVDDDKVDFVLREKEIMQQMHHPFIIRLYQTFQDPYFVYMLMQFVQGGELWSLMHPSTENGDTTSVRLPEYQAKFYTYSVADALAYIHGKNCVYRDLKPENIMIDRTGYPVLIDFGLARFLEKDDKAYTMVGTPSYLSPEMVESAGHNASVDHWALGVLLYELLTASNPFFWEGMDQMTLFNDIIESDFPRPEGINEHAIDLIAALLIKDPEMRLGNRCDQDILSHVWFQDMNLEAMRRRKIPAPWVPTVKSALDTCCFQDWSELEDMTDRKFPRLDSDDEARFEAF